METYTITLETRVSWFEITPLNSIIIYTIARVKIKIMIFKCQNNLFFFKTNQALLVKRVSCKTLNKFIDEQKHISCGHSDNIYDDGAHMQLCVAHTRK